MQSNADVCKQIASDLFAPLFDQFFADLPSYVKRGKIMQVHLDSLRKQAVDVFAKEYANQVDAYDALCAAKDVQSRELHQTEDDWEQLRDRLGEISQEKQTATAKVTELENENNQLREALEYVSQRRTNAEHELATLQEYSDFQREMISSRDDQLLQLGKSKLNLLREKMALEENLTKATVKAKKERKILFPILKLD